MHQLLGLALDRLDDRRVGVAEVHDRDAGGEVEVLHAVLGEHAGALAADERRGAGVGVHLVVGAEGGDVFGLFVAHVGCILLT